MKVQARTLLITLIVCISVLAVSTFAEDIVINQDTIWSTGTYDYNSVSVTNGAVLTCDGQVTLNAQNLTVDSGASISADHRGYGSSQGPGAPAGNYWTGASYGGRGGKSSTTSSTEGPTYGSVTEPEDMGSGGSTNNGGTGGSGGGAIHLTVAGTLTINGSITSNGQNGQQSYYSGGGSGGSVYITAETLSGSGVISVNGGNGSNNSGGGGGGRIAVYCDTDTFTGNISAHGGSGYRAGGAGTIYTKLAGQIAGDLLINNEGIEGTVTQLTDSPYTFDKVEIRNEAILELSNTGILNTGELVAEPDGQIVIDDSGRLEVPIVQLSSGGELVLNNGGQLDCEQVRILSGGTFLLNTSYVLPTMEISAGGILSHSANDPEFNLTIAGDLSVDSGASISANGKGYGPAQGPGAPSGAYWSGAGYGGRGGRSSSTSSTVGPTYGSAVEPNDMGSGGSGGSSSTGGSGGGLIRLTVAGTLIVNGSITSNGQNGPQSYYSGGGSGGSVYLTAGTLTGSGMISANGGNGSNNSGGGGGGRIAVFYKNSGFSGIIEAEGGAGWEDGESGTVMVNDSLPSTSAVMSETHSSSSNLIETLLSRKVDFNSVTVTGDFNGVFDFNDFEAVTIESGSFTGQGFAKATWQANLDGATYAGVWHALVIRDQTETGSTIYMKGVISGEISGITEGYFVESVNEPNVIHTYSSKWMLNKMPGQMVSSTIELSGVVNYQQTTEYPATSLYVLQASFDANCYGDYTGPLNVILTHVRVMSQPSAYYGEGFSLLSYTSDMGQGLASCYNTLEASAVAQLKGSCDNPLMGVLSATLDENSSVKRLSVNIERVDFGLPPESLVSVELFAPSQASPGETMNYIIEYRNDGTKPAENVHIIHKLPRKVQFISQTGEGYYRTHGIYDDSPEVVWIVDTIPPKSKGYLGTTVLIDWGLTEADVLDSFVMAEEFDFHIDPNITIDSTEIDANDSSVTVEYVVHDGNVGDWILNETCTVEEAVVEMNEPNLIFTETATGFISSLEFTVNPQIGVIGDGAPLGRPRNLDDLIIKYIISAPPETIAKYDRYVVLLNEYVYLTWLSENDYIDEVTYEDFQINKGEDLIVAFPVEDLVGRFDEAGPYYDLITGSIKDSLINLSPDELGAAIAEHESQKEEPRIRTDSSEHAVQDTLRLHLDPRYGIVRGRPYWWHGGPYFIKEKVAKLNSDPSQDYGVVRRALYRIKVKILKAFDPNKKYGPNGKVLPGQTLDYKVEFENVGKGIAFGVYFTDTLDEDVNDVTLQIGPVKDVNNGSIIGEPGIYNPATRTITWFVGRVDPNQGGYAEFSVNVNNAAQHGTEIINYATIYFPSVPQELRTNGIISTVLLNLPPEADAGPDQSAHIGEVVVLDGSGSTDPDEDVLTFNWAFGLKPYGSQAVLDEPNSLNPTFVPDITGTYTVTLRVSDGQEQSQFDVIKISTVNVAPIADAGEDKSVHVGELVTLDGTGSTDPDGDSVFYHWEFTSIPQDSNTILNTPNSVSPSFVADIPGVYIVNLIVNDGEAYSEPDTVTISTVNLAPVANAGEDQAVYVGDLVTLDGSGSSDPDGDPLIYRWAFTVVPQDSNAMLDDPNSVNPTFTADFPGTYVISLVVNDDTENSLPDTVSISTINIAPTADAGVDQAVYVNDIVSLDGSDSFDPDGDDLSYHWSFTTLPQASNAVLSDPNVVDPNFTSDVAGTYILSLVVNDGTIDSQPDTVSISTINVAPIADAGQSQSAYVGDTVTLDGSNSFDPDGDELSYSWAFTSRPVGSSAELQDHNSVYSSFVPDLPGTYAVSLIVSDGVLNSEPSSMTVSVVTDATAAIVKVQNIIDTVNGFDDSVFKNSKRRKALTNKFNAVIDKLENAEFQEAYQKLENDLLKKTDGCASSGEPDKNDWIVSCDAQNVLYPLIVDVIDFLEQLI